MLILASKLTGKNILQNLAETPGSISLFKIKTPHCEHETITKTFVILNFTLRINKVLFPSLAGQTMTVNQAILLAPGHNLSAPSQALAQ